ncbi:MAG TPA: EamA family transporter [Verrucomicrobiota bacterium]|nr:hypothetical protein [Verrucomicrobiales bacterium]HRI11395.1 EamA family transporter [Verrucomicrobiota bacterium]
MPRWLVWTLLALVSWGVWAVFSKLIGDGLSATHSQALSTIGLLPLMLVLAVAKRSTNPGSMLRGASFALGAGLLSAFGNLAYYDILQRGGKAATVIPLTALYPLVTVLLAVLFLHEKLNRFQMGGVLLSLGAIYLFNVTSERGLLSSALGIALLPLLLWGVSGFFQKLSTNHLSGPRSALMYFVAFLPVALGIVWREPVASGQINPRIWALVLTLGLFLALGNFALMMAFARGKAAIIAPLAAMYPLVSVPVAILFFGERVGSRELIGIGLALLASIALAWETKPPPPDQVCSNRPSNVA